MAHQNKNGTTTLHKSTKATDCSVAMAATTMPATQTKAKALMSKLSFTKMERRVGISLAVGKTIFFHQISIM